MLLPSSHAFHSIFRIVPSFLITLLIPASILLSATCIQAQTVPKFDAPDSTFGQFGKELSKAKTKLLKLSPADGKLTPKFETGGGSARSNLQNIANRVKGARGGGSSSSGGNNWSSSIRGSELSISAGYGQRYWNPTQTPVMVSDSKSFYLQLKQHQDDKTFCLVTARKDNSFDVRLRDKKGAYTFDFVQSKTGEITCVELGTEFQIALSADNFDALAAQNPEFISQRLTPVFNYIGLGEPPTRFHPFVKKYVTAKLRPANESELAKFKEAIAPMDEGDFKTREKVTGEIEKDFEKWELNIENAITDSNFSTEVRARLKKIYEKNVEPGRRALLSLIGKGNLIESPAYLVWLLENEEEKEDRSNLIKQLEKVTEQQLGDDLKAWKQWLNEDNVAGNAKPIEFKSLVETKGLLDDLAEVTGTLIHFRVEDSKLAVDKDHWKASLGGQTVKEATAEIRKFIKSRNLPEKWFKPGSQYPEATVEFPQVVFDRMISGQAIDTQLASRMNVYSRYTINSANRMFIGTKLSALLETHVVKNQRFFNGALPPNEKPVKQEYLNLELDEKSDAERSLMYHDDQKGSLVVDIRFPKLDSRIRVMQNSDKDKDGNGCYLIYAIGKDASCLKASDYQTLRKENEETWLKFQPLFKKFGIHFPE